MYPSPQRTYSGATPFWEVPTLKPSQPEHPIPVRVPPKRLVSRGERRGGYAAAARVAARRLRRGRARRGGPYAGALITAIVAPEAIGSPSLTASVSTIPALWAVISFSIFIASMMQTICPSWTSWPCSTSTFHMLP